MGQFKTLQCEYKWWREGPYKLNDSLDINYMQLQELDDVKKGMTCKIQSSTLNHLNRGIPKTFAGEKYAGALFGGEWSSSLIMSMILGSQTKGI